MKPPRKSMRIHAHDYFQKIFRAVNDDLTFALYTSRPVKKQKDKKMNLYRLMEYRWMNFSVMAFLIGAALIPVISFPSLATANNTSPAMTRTAPAPQIEPEETQPLLQQPIPSNESLYLAWTMV